MNLMLIMLTVQKIHSIYMYKQKIGMVTIYMCDDTESQVQWNQNTSLIRTHV